MTPARRTGPPRPWLVPLAFATPALVLYLAFTIVPLLAVFVYGTQGFEGIARRGFAFFRHVAFDQLITPQTVYLSRAEIERWLSAHANLIERGSTYVIFRNGNSWKFGGRKAG